MQSCASVRNSISYLDIDGWARSSTYTAQNVFGASVVVGTVETDRWGVLPESQSDSQPHAIPDLSKWPKIHVSRQEAPSVKANLIGVVIGRVVEPPILESNNEHTPTATDPRATIDHRHGLNLALEALWIIRRDTGAVLAKVSAADLAPMSADTNPASAQQRPEIAANVRACWKTDAVSVGMSKMSVTLNVITDATGTVRLASVAEEDRDKLSDPTFQSFAERAVRAAMGVRCATLPLPNQMLGKTNHLTFRFRP